MLLAMNGRCGPQGYVNLVLTASAILVGRRRATGEKTFTATGTEADYYHLSFCCCYSKGIIDKKLQE